MRSPVKGRNKVGPDYKYNSDIISKFINYIMERGKKNVAREIVYNTLEKIKTITKSEPMEVFEQALRNVGPLVEVRSRRIGGANYQVPREIRPERKGFLSMKWIIEAARAKKGKSMVERLSETIIEASKGEGEAIKKRENMHRMAEANKAFAHFSW